MPDAIYNLILDDVESIIGTTIPTWAKTVRDTLILLDTEAQALPIAIIVPLYQANVEEAMNDQICIAHQVGVALIWEGNRSFARNREIINTIRDVRKALHIPNLPTATTGTDPGGVWDADIDLNPTFDVSALTANVKFSLMKLTYKSWEEAR